MYKQFSNKNRPTSSTVDQNDRSKTSDINFHGV